MRQLIKEKIDQIYILTEKTGLDFDREVIHEFRVTVKALRSFLRLLRLHSDKKGLKMPGKFKRLYNIAGALRETQLETDRMAGSKVVLHEYFNKQQHLLMLQKNEWQKHYKKKIIKKLERKLMSVKYEALNPEVLQRFFTDCLAAVEQISKSKHASDEQVHRVRKKVKDILYTSKLTAKKGKDAQSHMKVIPVKELNQLAEVIGQYNDERLTRQHLTSFSSPDMDAKETSAIKKICGNEKTRLELEKKKILDMVKEMCTRNAQLL